MERSLILMALVSAVYSCTLDLPYYARSSNATLETDNTRVHFSEYIVFGSVKQNVTGRKYPYNGMDGIYTVAFEVLCSYKGGVVPKTIYIAGMGNENKALPGCPTVKVGSKYNYIMYLKNTSRTKSDAIYEIEYAPTGGEAEIILDDLTINCGLELHETTEAKECSDFIPLNKEEGCVQWKKPAPTTAASTAAPTTVPTTVPTTIPEKDTDEIDVKPVPEEDEDNQSDQGGYDTKTEKTVDNGGKTGKVSDNDPTGSAGKLASSFLLAIVSISFAILL